MSDPIIVTGCGEPIWGVVKTCPQRIPIVYYSAELTNSCPSGYIGGPFTLGLGRFTSLISQSDADAQASAYMNTLLATCSLSAPVVSNGSITVGPSGAVNYQIVATNSPTSYGATGLPTGLSINTSTGLISGTVPATLTTYTIPISATNAAGTGNGTLTINVILTKYVTFEGMNDYGYPYSILFSIDGDSPFIPIVGTAYSFLTSVLIHGTMSSGNFDVHCGLTNVTTLKTGSYIRVVNSGDPIINSGGNSVTSELQFPDYTFSVVPSESPIPTGYDNTQTVSSDAATGGIGYVSYASQTKLFEGDVNIEWYHYILA